VVAASLFAVTTTIAGAVVALAVATFVPVTGPDSTPAASVAAQTRAEPPERRKIDSQLLQEIDRRRGLDRLKGTPQEVTSVRVDPKGRALVDVRADVAPDLDKLIRGAGGTVVSTSAEYRSTIAWVPLLRIEELARDAAVLGVVPAAEATTNR